VAGERRRGGVLPRLRGLDAAKPGSPRRDSVPHLGPEAPGGGPPDPRDSTRRHGEGPPAPAGRDLNPRAHGGSPTGPRAGADLRADRVQAGLNSGPVAVATGEPMPRHRTVTLVGYARSRALAARRASRPRPLRPRGPGAPRSGRGVPGLPTPPGDTPRARALSRLG